MVGSANLYPSSASAFRLLTRATQEFPFCFLVSTAPPASLLWCRASRSATSSIVFLVLYCIDFFPLLSVLHLSHPLLHFTLQGFLLLMFFSVHCFMKLPT